MKIVFMGTPDFAAPSLESLIESEHEVSLVISQPDRVGNRGKLTMPIIKEIALRENIGVLQPDRVKDNEELLNILKEINPNLIVVAAYGRILPKAILDLPKFGCINVHASLLPKFRGASPIQHAILTGETHTGVTIMKMAEGLDTGDIFSQASLEIEGNDYPLLSRRLAILGAKLLLDTIEQIEKGDAHAFKQDESKVSITGIIKKNDGLISFSNEEASHIERKLRAYNPWPGISFGYKDGRIKIKAAELIKCETYKDLDSGLKPGTVIFAGDEGIDVLCKKDIIRIKELQAPGKRSMKSGEYLRGNKLAVGTHLEEKDNVL